MAGSDAIVEGGVINGKGNGLVGTREKKKKCEKNEKFQLAKRLFQNGLFQNVPCGPGATQLS